MAIAPIAPSNIKGVNNSQSVTSSIDIKETSHKQNSGKKIFAFFRSNKNTDAKKILNTVQAKSKEKSTSTQNSKTIKFSFVNQAKRFFLQCFGGGKSSQKNNTAEKPITVEESIYSDANEISTFRVPTHSQTNKTSTFEEPVYAKPNKTGTSNQKTKSAQINDKTAQNHSDTEAIYSKLGTLTDNRKKPTTTKAGQTSLYSTFDDFETKSTQNTPSNSTQSSPSNTRVETNKTNPVDHSNSEEDTNTYVNMQDISTETSTYVNMKGIYEQKNDDI